MAWPGPLVCVVFILTLIPVSRAGGATNPCATNPCLNGGTCSNNQGTAACACRPSYTGTTCEFYNNPCSPNPCQNGGTCTDQAGVASCSCAPFYTDSTCNTYNDPCSPNPCENGGTCLANTSCSCGSCSCPPSYTDATCSTQDPCSPNPCQNGGTCTDQSGSASCSCAPCYSGSTCDTYIDSPECVTKELNALLDIMNGTQTGSSTKEAERLAKITQSDLLQSHVQTAVDILGKVAGISSSQPPDIDTLKNFVQSADNLLQAPADVWKKLTTHAFSLLNAVDTLGTAASNVTTTELEIISTDKIVLQTGQSRDDIVFPNRSKSDDYPSWAVDDGNSIFLSKDAFPASVVSVKYSAVMYRNLSNVFSVQLDRSLTEEKSSELSVDSVILTLSIANVQDTIKQPVELTFKHTSGNFREPSCRFLDYSSVSTGVWSTRGCTLVTSNEAATQCSCDHLTNFAVLMRPDDTPFVIRIILIVACCIAILCLLVAMIRRCVVSWGDLKSDRNAVLFNQWVVLLLAYFLLLIGLIIKPPDHEIGCKVVSALLHYLFLVAFFLKLCEALNIFRSVVSDLPVKSVWLVILAYGLPAIVVAVSLGVRLDGYGGSDFCWVNVDDPLIWAFVGPALVTVLAIIVCVALVIRKLHSGKASPRDQATPVLAICVMTPILGLIWVFGVLSVNKDTVAFQWLFLTLIIVQEFLRFLFYCYLSTRVREGRLCKAGWPVDPKQSSEPSVPIGADKEGSMAARQSQELQQLPVSSPPDNTQYENARLTPY